MRSSPHVFQRWLPAISAATPLILLSIAALSLQLAAAEKFALPETSIASWILALYALPGLLSLVLTVRYRQPLLLTGNFAVVIFIASLADHLSYPEAAGATLAAGAGVLLISAVGITHRLAALVPAPVVHGLLAGAVLPFVTDAFTSMKDAPLLVGGTFLGYVGGQRLLGKRLPAILPAMIVGLLIAGATGQFGQVPDRLPFPVPAVTLPAFSVHAIATATPVLIILLTLQSNVPSMVFLESQGYDPPDRVLNTVSGLGTLLASLLGPTGISLSLPATALVAGPDAGDRQIRCRPVYLASAAAILVGMFAGLAAALPRMIPVRLLLVLAGLAVISLLANSLQQMVKGPVVLGPSLAFAISLSNINILGFGPFFWALVVGTGTSQLIERDQMQALRFPVPH